MFILIHVAEMSNLEILSAAKASSIVLKLQLHESNLAWGICLHCIFIHAIFFSWPNLAQVN